MEGAPHPPQSMLPLYCGNEFTKRQLQGGLRRGMRRVLAAVCNVSLVTAAPLQLLGGVRQEQNLVIHGTVPHNMGLKILLFLSRVLRWSCAFRT